MQTRKDYYKILGVAKGASEKEIKRAYRHLARKYHPDVNPGNKSAEERFKDVQEAYDVLSDPKKRQVYEQLGFYSEGYQPGREQGAAGFDFSGFDFGGGGAASFSEIFSDLFRGARQPSSAPERGQDLQYHVKLPFLDAIHGRSMRININRREACEFCGGTGQVRLRSSEPCRACEGTGRTARARGILQFSTSCQVCGGTGRGSVETCTHCSGQGHFKRSETISVRIPPGVSDGSRVRIPRKGDAGSNGALSGDLYLVIEIEPHPIFRREGEDIACSIPITITEAALGTKIEVPTLGGKSLLKIPPGTQTGQKFRLRGKGVTSPRGGTPGDLIVEVRLTLPKISDERSKQILREFARLNPENPRVALGLD